MSGEGGYPISSLFTRRASGGWPLEGRVSWDVPTDNGQDAANDWFFGASAGPATAVASQSVTMAQSASAAALVQSTSDQSFSIGQSASAAASIQSSADQAASLQQSSTAAVATSPVTAAQSFAVGQAATATVGGGAAVSASADQSIDLGQTASAAALVAGSASNIALVQQSALVSSLGGVQAAQSVELQQSAQATGRMQASADQAASLQQSSTATVATRPVSGSQQFSIAQSAAGIVEDVVWLATASQPMSMGQSCTARLSSILSADQIVVVGQAAWIGVQGSIVSAQSFEVRGRALLHEVPPVTPRGRIVRAAPEDRTVVAEEQSR